MNVVPPSVEMLNPPRPPGSTPRGSVAAYTVAPSAYTPYTKRLPRPLVVVRVVNVAPPSVEIPRPSKVAAYTVPPSAYTPRTMLLYRPQ